MKIGQRPCRIGRPAHVAEPDAAVFFQLLQIRPAIARKHERYSEICPLPVRPALVPDHGSRRVRPSACVLQPGGFHPIPRLEAARIALGLVDPAGNAFPGPLGFHHGNGRQPHKQYVVGPIPTHRPFGNGQVAATLWAYTTCMRQFARIGLPACIPQLLVDQAAGGTLVHFHQRGRLAASLPPLAHPGAVGHAGLCHLRTGPGQLFLQLVHHLCSLFGQGFVDLPLFGCPGRQRALLFKLLPTQLVQMILITLAGLGVNQLALQGIDGVLQIEQLLAGIVRQDERSGPEAAGWVAKGAVVPEPYLAGHTQGLDRLTEADLRPGVVRGLVAPLAQQVEHLLNLRVQVQLAADDAQHLQLGLLGLRRYAQLGGHLLRDAFGQQAQPRHAAARIQRQQLLGNLPQSGQHRAVGGQKPKVARTSRLAHVCVFLPKHDGKVYRRRRVEPDVWPGMHGVCCNSATGDGMMTARPVPTTQAPATLPLQQALVHARRQTLRQHPPISHHAHAPTGGHPRTLFIG